MVIREGTQDTKRAIETITVDPQHTQHTQHTRKQDRKEVLLEVLEAVRNRL